MFSSIALLPLWAEEAGTTATAIGVRQFMRQVEKYPGPVTVEGVVSQVSPKHKMLALIDVQELKECKVVTCARLTLPVRWNGSMPKVKSIVQVDGEIREEGKHLVFFAKVLRKVK
jgi:hypothetical protein